MTRKTFSYSHGDTGTEPPNPLNFEQNERPESQQFDWFWYNVIQSINGHAQEFTRLDRDDDGVVDAADGAATWSQNGEVKSTHPTDLEIAGDLQLSNDGDGTATVSVVTYTDADAISAINGEATLSVDISGDADTLDGEDKSYYSVAGHTHGEDDVTYNSTSLSAPVTKWANGLTDEEIYRVELQAGESLEVHRLEIEPKGGGSVSGLSVDVFDATNNNVLASTSDVVTGSPAGSSGSGATILVRISNSSGSSQNASINSELHVV